MAEYSSGQTGGTPPRSRFTVAPPRHFVFPAVMLLLSEQPDHGYNLVKELRRLHQREVDRPAVYRALAQLEGDGLVVSTTEDVMVRHTRRVYRLTDLGERTLRQWMGAIKAERDLLDQVLRRYYATGTADAALAEVAGGWAELLGGGASALSSTWLRHRPRRAEASRYAGDYAAEPADPESAPAHRPTTRHNEGGRNPNVPPEPRRYHLVPERSVLLVETRSTVGPISFGVVGLRGWIDGELLRTSSRGPGGAENQERRPEEGNATATGGSPTARLELSVSSLRSGNAVYDAELLRRIDARRHPIAAAELKSVSVVGTNGRCRIAGDLTFHGVTRRAAGAVTVETRAGGQLAISGEEVFDIRDFDVASPAILMFRIYPDVRVRLHIEAEPEE